MITKNSIIIAEPLVLNRGEIDKTVSPALSGLASLAKGTMPYSDDYRNEIVASTLENEEFNTILSASSDELAEGVREAFRELRVYGKGFVNAVSSALSETFHNRLSGDGISFVLSQALNLRYIKADNDFFSSLVYPTEVKNKNWSFDGVDLSVMRGLKFNYMNVAELEEWLGATHPDVIKCLHESDVPLDESLRKLTTLDCMHDMFTAEGDVFNFNHVKIIQTYNLFQMYFILTKMYLSDEPIPALQSGDLEAYRGWVNMLWHAMTMQLISMKQLLNNFKSRTIALFENKTIELESKKMGNGVIKVLKGDATVIYTTVAVKLLSDNNMSLSDWAIARALSKYSKRSADVDGVALMSGTEARWLIEDYLGENRSIFLQEAASFFKEEARKTVMTWMSTLPEMTDIADSFDSEYAGIGIERIWNRIVQGNDGLFRRIIAVYEKNPGMSTDAAVMSTRLPVLFLNIIGCEFAAKVVAGTITDKEESEEDKRVRLNYAVIQALVTVLVKK